MSQSKISYEANTRKSTAQARRERHDNNSGTDTGGEPACRSRSVGHSIDQREWREVSYEERILLSYRPCSWPECFPSGPPDANEIETVIRSCRHPTTYHRPRDVSAESCEKIQINAGETEISRAERTHARESIESISDLRDGDGVIWKGQSIPMFVVEAPSDSTGVAHLVGPSGGEYYIEGRPKYARPYYVRGFGCRQEIRRVVSVDH